MGGDYGDWRHRHNRRGAKIVALVRDRDSLVAALRKHGVDWLAPSDAANCEVAPEILVASLAAHDDPRLRSALTGLFILHPEFSAVVNNAVNALDAAARDELTARYMAAAYLQRLWRTRLGLYLGDYNELPDLFSVSLSLPTANEGYGKIGLHVLAEWHKKRSSDESYNRLAEYNREMEHVFASLKIRAVTHEPAVPG